MVKNPQGNTALEHLHSVLGNMLCNTGMESKFLDHTGKEQLSNAT